MVAPGDAAEADALAKTKPFQASVELEHAIGFVGSIPGGLHMLPTGEDMVYASGSCLIMANLEDPHKQVFLRGHSERIGCFDVSPDGSLAASGQVGKVADVVVWDLAQRCEKFRLQQHDAQLEGGIAVVSFSDCGRFLLTVGLLPEDGHLIVWDMQTGYIVASTERTTQITAARWGGRIKDVKRRPTTHPQFVTAAKDGLRFWDLDPMQGLSSEPCITANQQRVYTALAFSPAEDRLFAGTETGDFCIFTVPRRLSNGDLERINLQLTVLVCGGGVRSLTTDSARLFVGGGDGSVTAFMADGEDDFRPTKVDDNLGGAVTTISASGGRLLYGTASGDIFERRGGGPSAGKAKLVSASPSGAVVALAYAGGDSQRFATASEDGMVRVWSAVDYSVESSCMTKDAGRPSSLAFSGEVIITGWEDGAIRASDADEGVALWAIAGCHKGPVRALILSHNQRFLCSGGDNGVVRVWEIKTKGLVSHLIGHEDGVRLERGGRAPRLGHAHRVAPRCAFCSPVGDLPSPTMAYAGDVARVVR